ncbi:MAG: sporulation integral membrane protein YtvI [Anaerocolumna sp.]
MKNGIVYLKIAVNLCIYILAFLFTIIVVPKLISFFMPFVIGFIISVIANPLVKFLEKRLKLVRKHSSAIIIIAVIGAIIGVAYGMISFMVREAAYFIEDLPSITQNIENQLNAIADRLQGVYEVMPKGMKQVIDSLGNKFSEFGSNIVSGENNSITFSEAGDYANKVLDILLMTIITILSSYFFIAERDNLAQTFRKITPKPLLNGYNLVVNNFKMAVGGYFKAQFKIMLILLFILFIGFEFLKVNYSFLLAFGVAFLDFLPFFGTGAVIWPWAIIEFLLGNYFRAISLLVIYLICQVVKQVLQPKMVGDSIGISPFATLVFMFVGYQFMDVLGMIIGIPIGMVLVSLYRVGIFNRILKGFKIIFRDLNEFRKF